MIKTRHKWIIAIALLIAIAAWLAWTLLTAETDLLSGRVPPPTSASAGHLAATFDTIVRPA
jgi:hypothetical protein